LFGMTSIDPHSAGGSRFSAIDTATAPVLHWNRGCTILRHEIRQGLALLQPLVILGGSGKLNVASGVQRRLDRILDDTNDKADTNDLHRNVIGDAEQRAGHRNQQQRAARNAGGTARAQCRHDGQQDGSGHRDLHAQRVGRSQRHDRDGDGRPC